MLFPLHNGPRLPVKTTKKLQAAEQDGGSNIIDVLLLIKVLLSRSTAGIFNDF